MDNNQEWWKDHYSSPNSDDWSKFPKGPPYPVPQPEIPKVAPQRPQTFWDKSPGKNWEDDKFHPAQIGLRVIFFIIGCVAVPVFLKFVFWVLITIGEGIKI